MNATTWWEAALLCPTIHIHLFACAVSLAATFLWWNSYHRKLTPRPRSEHGSQCNDPNCLRCHSFSQFHIRSFQTNAKILRRLAKLEPEMFEGTRKEIWRAIEDLERRQEGIRDSTNKASRPRITGNTTSGSAIPLSPQLGQNPSVFFLPGLEAVPWHCVAQCHDQCPCMNIWKTIPPSKNSPPTPLTGDLEALQKSYPIIRQEFLDFLSSNQPFNPFDPKVYTSANVGNNMQPEWSSIYLYHQGRRQVETCKINFPRTTEILETQCPHLMAGKCGFGSVYFSKLEKNTKVKEHCGPTNIRWRCHLPLIVPTSTNSCLCVGVPGVNEKSSGWEEGVPLLFDDSFLHSAVHHGVLSAGNGDPSPTTKKADMGGARTVLIVDFWHPALSEPDRISLAVLYPPGS